MLTWSNLLNANQVGDCASLEWHCTGLSESHVQALKPSREYGMPWCDTVMCILGCQLGQNAKKGCRIILNSTFSTYVSHSNSVALPLLHQTRTCLSYKGALRYRRWYTHCVSGVLYAHSSWWFGSSGGLGQSLTCQRPPTTTYTTALLYVPASWLW